jgi:hypothetical protein
MGKITINQESLRTSREWKRHKVEEGSNVYRVLPPFGDPEIHKNYPYRKWSIAWLLDPKSGNRRPFATPMTDGEDCPVKEYQDALKEAIDAKKAELKAQGCSDAEIKEQLKGLHEVQWNVRVQHLYAYNACDKSGNVGLLELKSTAHKAMKKMMSQYIQEYGQDPTSLNSDLEDDAGVWFNIKKEGSGKETEYNVEYHQSMVKINGRPVREDDRSPLPDVVVQNFQNDLGYDLNALYKRKTYDEMRDILLFNLAQIAEDVPEAVLPGYEEALTQDSAPAKVETKVQDKPKATTKTSTKPVALNLGSDDEEGDEPEEDIKPVTRTAAAVAKKSGGGIEDIKNFADSILGD